MLLLAVETIDGTDAPFVGGSLENGQAVVVKNCKSKQNRRFDLPAVGILVLPFLLFFHLSPSSPY